MTVLDIDSAELAWHDLTPAGGDAVARMAALWHDEARGHRTVLVDFPDGWRRDASGRQPSQEEMVVLSGAMRISGRRSGPGQLLVCEPWATRSQTWNEPGTRVLAWFSGETGGWVDGPADPPREVQVTELTPGLVRPPADTLVGSIEVRKRIGGEVLDADADLLWLGNCRWAHLRAGERAPDEDGLVVVKHWA